MFKALVALVLFFAVMSACSAGVYFFQNAQPEDCGVSAICAMFLTVALIATNLIQIEA